MTTKKSESELLAKLKNLKKEAEGIEEYLKLKEKLGEVRFYENTTFSIKLEFMYNQDNYSIIIYTPALKKEEAKLFFDAIQTIINNRKPKI